MLKVDMSNTTLIEQYLSIKKNYEKELLLFRLGDFYELYYSDALTASSMIGLALTERKNNGEKVPMCGVPYHSLNNHIARLIEAGFKVAVADQSDSITDDGINARSVVRVYSAGTIIEEEILQKRGSNFLASIYKGVCGYSVCWADVSTGEIFVEELGAEVETLEAKLISLMPIEIIYNSAALNVKIESVGTLLPKPELFYDMYFTPEKAEEVILNQYQINSLRPMGIEGKGCLCAAGAAIAYISQKLMTSAYLDPIKEVCADTYMHIDANTRKNLDLIVTSDNRKKGSLLWLLDRTRTPMGGRLLNCWLERPLNSKDSINERLKAVNVLQDKVTLAVLQNSLEKLPDVCKLITKLSNKLLKLSDAEKLAVFFRELPAIRNTINGSSSKLIVDIYDNLDGLQELSRVFKKAIGDKDAAIRCGYDLMYDKAAEAYRLSLENLNQYCEEERRLSGIRGIKLENNKVYGYFFEINEKYAHLVPDHFVKKSSLSKSGRYITPRLKALEEDVLDAALAVSGCEQKIFAGLCEKISEHIAQLRRTSRAVAALDVLCSFAELSHEYDYIMPKIASFGDNLTLKGSRHPLVERFINGFIKNDLEMSFDKRFILLTGPNMSGKSTYMRQVALITILSHIGCYVPADFAEIPLVDRLFTRVGASDDLIFNKSTFMVEMIEAAYITNLATKNSLIILDELGRGTSTCDGVSIARAIAEHIAENITAKTLFATHYRELCDMEGNIQGIVNYHFSAKEDDGTLIFLNKVMRGSSDKSFGIEVASIAGINKSIIERAKELQSKSK